jgi:hypothetical protein
MTTSSPARPFAMVVGVTLVGGIIGFFSEATFADDKAVRDAVFAVAMWGFLVGAIRSWASSRSTPRTSCTYRSGSWAAAERPQQR